MVKIIMKRIPKKVDASVQHKVLENWSKTMVETHTPTYDVKIFSAREFAIKTDTKKTFESK